MASFRLRHCWHVLAALDQGAMANLSAVQFEEVLAMSDSAHQLSVVMPPPSQPPLVQSTACNLSVHA